MSLTVALTGASGSMGRETLRQLMECENIGKIKVLMLPTIDEKICYKRWKKQYGKRIDVIFGNIANIDNCKQLVKDCDYLVNMAAVIPPKSDHHHDLAYEANILGPQNLVKVLQEMQFPPKFLHISSVAVYGNRNYKHPWGRVGDPLLPSVFDVYAKQKMTAELFVTESNLKYWCILRQTAMLHNKMLTNNMKDGLMFHTCYNAPLEWVTAKDSGLLIKNIILTETTKEGFWRNIYNIGGLEHNRSTGYDTFNDGFKIIGGSAESFLNPSWNILRNFHGMWFSDSNELNDMFDFVKQTKEEYWQEILNHHKYYKIAKVFPPRLISFLAIKRLLRDDNAPRYWIKHNDEARVYACFGDDDNIKALTNKWEDFSLLSKNQISGVNYEQLKANPTMLDHGYDESIPLESLTEEDYSQAANFRGGDFISKSDDIYKPATWSCAQGHTFKLTPFAVLRGGHWCPMCNNLDVWDYDEHAKTNKFYAQVWYDSHAKNENKRYSFVNGYALLETRFFDDDNVDEFNKELDDK